MSAKMKSWQSKFSQMITLKEFAEIQLRKEDSRENRDYLALIESGMKKHGENCPKK